MLNKKTILTAIVAAFGLFGTANAEDPFELDAVFDSHVLLQKINAAMDEQRDAFFLEVSETAAAGIERRLAKIDNAMPAPGAHAHAITMSANVVEASETAQETFELQVLAKAEAGIAEKIANMNAADASAATVSVGY